MKTKKAKIMKQIVFVDKKGESIGNISHILTYKDYFYVLTDKGIFTDAKNENIPNIMTPPNIK